MKKRSLFLAVILSVALFVCGLAGCGAAGAPGGAGGGEDGAQENIVAGQVNRKIVYYVRMALKAGDVGAVKDGLLAKNARFGGYVAEQNAYFDDGEYSEVSLVFKVPTERLDEFVNAIGEQGEVSSKNVTARDITTEYVDAEARKNALLAKKTALQGLLSEADVSAGDKIAIIGEIASVDAELQAIELQLKGYDSLVEYSTVSLQIFKTTRIGEVLGVIVLVVALVGLFTTVIVLSVKLVNEKYKRRNDRAPK